MLLPRKLKPQRYCDSIRTLWLSFALLTARSPPCDSIRTDLKGRAAVSEVISSRRCGPRLASECALFEKTEYWVRSPEQVRVDRLLRPCAA